MNDDPFAYVARKVAAVIAGVRGSGPEAAMEPGSQTAQPAHSEPLVEAVPEPAVPFEPWRDSPGVARRRARLAEQYQVRSRF